MTIQKADPATRKRVLYLIGAAAIIGTAVVHWGMPLLLKYQSSLPPKESLKIMCLFISIPFIFMSTIGFYICLLGYKTLKTNQFPPRGAKVIHDTPLLTGSAAVRRGKEFILCGIILILLSVGAAGYFPLGLYKSFSRNLPTSSNSNSGTSGLR